MYQTISEKIEVAGVYRSATFVPKKFLWKNKEFHIEETTFIANTSDGKIQSRIYSVLVKNNLYRLRFNRTEELWTLEEVWFE